MISGKLWEDRRDIRASNIRGEGGENIAVKGQNDIDTHGRAIRIRRPPEDAIRRGLQAVQGADWFRATGGRCGSRRGCWCWTAQQAKGGDAAAGTTDIDFSIGDCRHGEFVAGAEMIARIGRLVAVVKFIGQVVRVIRMKNRDWRSL
jgi:hypothetical protein